MNSTDILNWVCQCGHPMREHTEMVNGGRGQCHGSDGTIAGPCNCRNFATRPAVDTKAWAIIDGPANDSSPVDPANPSIHLFTSGTKSSEVKPQYHLVPLESIRRLAARFKLGADRYGEDNWRNGLADPGFLGDRLNHAIEHLMLYANRDRSDDHLAAAMCNLAMLLTADEQRKAAGAAVATPPPVDRANTCRRCGHPRDFHESACTHPLHANSIVPGAACGCPIFTPS